MQVARESYRAHLIIWWAERISGTNFWKGKAAISEGYGKFKPHRLEGPDGRFQTETEARDYIFQAAKGWINNRFNEGIG
jgi:hypothetical protein